MTGRTTAGRVFVANGVLHGEDEALENKLIIILDHDLSGKMNTHDLACVLTLLT